MVKVREKKFLRNGNFFRKFIKPTETNQTYKNSIEKNVWLGFNLFETTYH